MSFEVWYDIIPLNKEYIPAIESINFDKNYVFVCDIDLFIKIVQYPNKPIKNEKLFTRNILQFMDYIISYNTDERFLNITTQKLNEYFGNEHRVKYKKILEDLEILTESHNYTQTDRGTFIKTRYNSTMIKSSTNTILFKEPKSIRYRIGDWLYTEDKEQALFIFKDSSRKKKKLDLNIDEELCTPSNLIAINEERINTYPAIVDEIDNAERNNLKPIILKKRITRLLNFNKKRYIKKGIKVDRVYSSFTGLSRISRKHLTKPYWYIDLKNSQPLLCSLTYPDIDEDYNSDVRQGIFYEHFYDLHPSYGKIPEKDIRNLIKPSIFKNIFFAFHTKSKWNKRFKTLYPQMHAYLEWVSEQEDISLAQELQNSEAMIFNNLDTPLSTHTFTLFDGIYFNNPGDKKYLYQQISDRISKLTDCKLDIKIITDYDTNY